MVMMHELADVDTSVPERLPVRVAESGSGRLIEGAAVSIPGGSARLTDGRSSVAVVLRSDRYRRRPSPWCCSTHHVAPVRNNALLKRFALPTMDAVAREALQSGAPGGGEPRTRVREPFYRAGSQSRCCRVVQVVVEHPGSS